MRNPDLSIVVPFYNEAKNIQPVIQTFAKFKRYNFELLCVNNGSTDESKKVFGSIIKKYSFVRVVEVKKNKGYGYGIMQGVGKAKADVIAWTHADLQTDPKDVFRAFDVYRKMNNANVVVKGNRVRRPLSQFLFSLGMAVVASILLRKIFYEINAQPKLFHSSFLKYLKSAPDDFSLDLYVLYKAKKFQYMIKTINVEFHKRQFGESKWAYSLKSRWKTIKRTFVYMQNLAKSVES